VNYNFTDRVRKVLAMAREETIRLEHDYIGTEHILLGLIREGAGMAVAVLTNLSVDPEQVQQMVENSVRPGKPRYGLGELPYNRGAMKVLEFAMAEARELNHDYVGTEHLLLGLLREERGVAGDVLTRLGTSLDEARQETLRLLSSAEPGVSRFSRDAGEVVNFNFTDRVRNALAMAREEASRLQHDYVGTEHILLGLIREGEGVAAAVLTLSVDLEQVQERVEESVRRGKATIALGELPYTSRAKKVLEFAMAEARDFGHSYVGTEHLLLGLLREEKGIAAEVLGQLGVSLEDARRETAKLLGSEPPAPRLSRSMEEAPDLARSPLSDGELHQMLVGLLHPAAMIALRLGANPGELRAALERAIEEVFDRN
jgi:ATP-dependent Clp protease ATP-binding subunit ClpA